MRSTFQLILTATFGIIISITILSYYGGDNWKLDLLSHFKVQYIIALMSTTLLGAVYIRKKIILLAFPLILLLSWDIFPFFFPQNSSIDSSNSISISSINLLSSNGEFEKVSAYIDSKNADILVLQEFTELWRLMLEPQISNYPHLYEIPRTDNFGIAIYSKYPFHDVDVVYYDKVGAPSIECSLVLSNQKIHLVATHPVPPINQEQFDSRNNQLKQIAQKVSGFNGETIVIGDLNTSSFSKHFKQFRHYSNLRDSRDGFGLQASWPTWFRMMKTTLDHCLISEGLTVNNRETGPFIGSDHLPVYVELGLKKSL